MQGPAFHQHNNLLIQSGLYSQLLRLMKRDQLFWMTVGPLSLNVFDVHWSIFSEFLSSQKGKRSTNAEALPDPVVLVYLR